MQGASFAKVNDCILHPPLLVRHSGQRRGAEMMDTALVRNGHKMLTFVCIAGPKDEPTRSGIGYHAVTVDAWDTRFLHAVHISVGCYQPAPARTPGSDVGDHQTHVWSGLGRLTDAPPPHRPAVPVSPATDHNLEQIPNLTPPGNHFPHL
jgi:hypothetical protein